MSAQVGWFYLPSVAVLEGLDPLYSKRPFWLAKRIPSGWKLLFKGELAIHSPAIVWGQSPVFGLMGGVYILFSGVKPQKKGSQCKGVIIENVCKF